MSSIPQKYILLPLRGISVGEVGPTNSRERSLFLALESFRAAKRNSRARKRFKTRFKVLDSIGRVGAKLIQMRPEQVATLQAEHPGLRIVPVVHYYPARARQVQPSTAPVMAATASQVTLQFVSAADKSPIVGATVTAIIEAAQGIGASGTTDSHGRVDLALGGAQVQVESLYVYVQDGFWDLAAQNALLKDGSTFQLKSIDLTYVDLLRDLYDESSVTAGSGVTVGVIDSGIGPHQDLRVAGGCNVSSGPRENPTDYSDNGTGHGTHVGGIIASLGAPPTGIRGVAPGVTLRSYRAAPSGQRSMDNFAITKALKQAADDGCDLINISLSGGLRDDSTHSALAMARDKGCVIFAASGNDDGGPVGFPASDSLTLAVTAFGRKGTFPDGTLEASYTPLAQGRNPDDFVAPFDNYGVEIVLTAPGVGIISTYPNNRYAVMDGTSMACGAVTGAAAVLLSHNPAILQMPRDQNRSNAVAKLVLNAASSLGFPATMQGKGYIKI